MGLQYLTDEKTRLYKDETSRSHNDKTIIDAFRVYQDAAS